MNHPFSRFEDEDMRMYRLLGNTMKKPGTQVLVEAVRALARQTFGSRSVDQIIAERRGIKAAEEPSDYGPKVQKVLFDPKA